MLDMQRLTRLFFVWVMLFALPVQGIAASWMMFCGSSHERPTLQGDPCPHAAAEHKHDQTLGEMPDSGEPTCSACAACFLSMAIPVRLIATTSPEPEGRVTRPPDALQPSHLPDGLERPPRRHTA